MEKDIDIEKEIKEKFNKKFIDVTKIVDLLNEFGAISLNKEYEKLTISKEDEFIMFELINSKLNYIIQVLNEDFSFTLEYFSTFAFKSLFLAEDDIKLDNLEEKLKCFEIIVTKLKNKDHPDEENFLKKMNKISYTKIFDLIANKFKLYFLGFIALVILNYSKSGVVFFRFFTLILETMFTFTIDFTEKDLEDMPVNNILEDLTNNFESREDTNLFHLQLSFSDQSSKHIIKKLFDLKEVKDYVSFGDEKKEKSSVSQKENKSKNKKDLNKNERTKKEKKSEAISEKIIENSKREEKNIENSKKDEKQEINIKEENKTPKNEDPNKIIEPKENEDEEDKEQHKEDEKFVSRKELNAIINNIVNEYNQTLQKLNEKINKRRKEVFDLNIEIIKLKSELKLIKSRDLLKAFIDYCCQGLRIDTKNTYENKTKNIIRKLIHFKYNTIYDEKIVINLINIFSNIYSKIQKGNELAHSIIKDKSFIESIIDISKNTGDENDFSNIIKIFKDEKTEELISSIINNRNNFFNDQELLKKNEEIIFKKIPEIGHLLMKN